MQFPSAMAKEVNSIIVC